MKKRSLQGWIVLIAAAVLSGCSGDSGEKLCVTQSIALNTVSPYYDGQWQGIIAASDGACYFGTSSHTLVHGGGFFRFDPRTEQFDVLVEDWSLLAGYTPSAEQTPQGKCHSPIVEVDGTLYLSTHIAAYWKPVLDKYPGSYILAYDTRNRQWRNYGIVKPRYSTYSAVEVDPGRGKIYAMIVPFAPQDKEVDGNHLYSIDMESGEKQDLGRVSDGKGNFWFYMDHRGRVWSPIWQGTGKLHCYDPETGVITTHEDAFPEAKLAPDGKTVENPRMKGKAWTWAQPIEGRRKCLFTMGDLGGGDERLWLFDPEKDIASKEAFTPLCYIGSTFLSVAHAGDRLYFIQRGDLESNRDYSTEGNRDLPPDENGYHVNNLHLKSVSLDPGDGYRIVDHGRIIDQEGRTPGYLGSLAADGQGNVYMNGSWLVREGDQPTLKYIYDEERYEGLSRGEFFAWVNVSKDLE